MGYLLEKIDETGDVKRQKESDRPKSSRTENNINVVKELISSQEDKPGTYATPNEISKMMDIPSDAIQNFKNRFSFVSYLLTTGSLISF